MARLQPFSKVSIQLLHPSVAKCTRACLALIATTSLVAPCAAWVLTVTPGTRAIYLQVGNGTANADNTTINLVSATVPANAVATGTVVAMTSDSTQANSFFDNFAVCNPPNQVYIGGFYRLPATSTLNATLQVTTPVNLVRTGGSETIPFSQISWTSTANGNAGADIPAGSFNATSILLRNIQANTWVENCHTFTYANAVPRAEGVYTGRATYTLTAP